MAKHKKRQNAGNWPWICAVLAIFLLFFTFAGLVARSSLQKGSLAYPEGPSEAPISSGQAILPSQFYPPVLKSLIVKPDSQNNYFDFLLETGDEQFENEARLKPKSEDLIKYFFLGITLPPNEFWVNLNPLQSGKIISPRLGRTDMGRVLLEADLSLKKDTASLTDPRTALGKEYWQRLNQKLQEQGINPAQVPGSTRVWIVPGSATVQEEGDIVTIIDSKLKVCLESEYLSRGDSNFSVERNSNQSSRQIENCTSEVFKEVILPTLEYKVNYGKCYAPLRQVYNSLILAKCYKQKYWGKGSFYSHCVHQGYLTGLHSREDWDKKEFFNAYLRSHKQGEYSFYQQEYDPELFDLVSRHYFSGGVDVGLSELEIKYTSPGQSQGESISSPIAFRGNTVLAKFFGKRERLSPWNGEVKVSFSVSPHTKGETILAKAEPAGLEGETAVSSPMHNWLGKVKLLFGEQKEKQIAGEGRGGIDFTRIETQDAKTIAKSPEAFEYSDPGQEFFGVDLEHFVWAQNRLAERALSAGLLKDVLSLLGIKAEFSSEEAAYKQIYQKLADGGYNKKVIDLINGSTYQDPRLRIVIIGQNKNPRAQGVYEAVANSLDALGLNIGQFGKGVKQDVDWLEPTGMDRIDVWTKTDNGIPYQATILKSGQGQNYIQIKRVTLQMFQEVFGQATKQGTIVRVTTKSIIPRTDEELDREHRNSQESIAQGIHKQFPYITSVEVTTQIGDEQPQKVNGFEAKQIIIPANISGYKFPEAKGKFTHVRFSDHSIEIIDNGCGMEAELISRMFVPKEGSKHPAPLSAETAQRELAKVRVVQDVSLPHRVSFARNGRVAVAIDIPEDIVQGATTGGGLMVEFGSLLDVPGSWDNIIIPLDLKSEQSNFQLALEYAINKIVEHPDFSNVDKARYINTIVTGLEGLIQGNENYAFVIKNICAHTRKLLTPLINQLKKDKVVILPHNRQFEKLAVSASQNILWLNKSLFDWRGAVNLKEIGGVIIPGVTLAGDKHLPLVIIPFTEESIAGSLKYQRQWHAWQETERIPIIKDRFVAIPANFAGSKRIVELTAKRIKGLTEEEDKELLGLLQMVNIITAEEVITAYEVVTPKENLRLASLEEISRSKGEIDSDAINEFLANAPVASGKPGPAIAAGNVPADANQKYVLAGNNVIDLDSKRILFRNIDGLEFLGNGYYKMKSGDEIALEKISPGLSELKLHVRSADGDIIVSPDKRFAYIQNRDGTLEARAKVFDLATEDIYYLANNFSSFAVTRATGKTSPYSNLQFSKDGRYLTYIEKQKVLVIVKVRPAQEILSERTGARTRVAKALSGAGEVIHRQSVPEEVNLEYAINPFANVAFLRDIDRNQMLLIDLETGKNIVPSILLGKSEIVPLRYLRTNSTGAYTVLIDEKGEMFIYVHKVKKLLSSRDFEGKEILAVSTFWEAGKAYYGAYLSSSRIAYFGEDGAVRKNFKLEQEYFEEINKGGEVRVFSNALRKEKNSSGSQIIPTTDNIDPLQRIEQKGIYKHPHFELFIDNTNPASPTAIDPLSGMLFPYAGTIIDYNANTKELLYFSLGELYYVKANERMSLSRVSERAVVDDTPARFVLYEERTDDGFHLLDIPNNRHYRLRDIGLEYKALGFDGKFFILSNPKTGDTVYLDPNKAGEPVFVSATEEYSGAFLDTKPVDAPDKFVIAQDKDGEFILNGDKKWGKGLARKMKKMNNNNFIITYADDSFYIGVVEDQDNVSFLYESKPSEYVLAYTDRVVLIGNKATGKKYIYDTHIKDERIGDGSISASGRFSIHGGGDELAYLDYKQDVPQPRTICPANEYQEYRVHPDADVVILKNARGKYDLFSLPLGAKVITNADHIEIDSFGRVAVAKKDDILGFYFLNPLSVRNMFYSDERIQIGSDENFVYLICVDKEDGKNSIKIYDKESASLQVDMDLTSFNEKTGIYTLPPRFWEDYGLQEKTVWDRQAGKEVPDIKSPYSKNTPTDPEFSLTLQREGPICLDNHSGGLSIHSLSLKGKRGSSYQLFLTLDSHFLTLDSYRKDYLQGGKVWYVIDEDKVMPSMENELFLDNEIEFGAGFVNQSKTFILTELIMEGKSRYYLFNANAEGLDITSVIPSGFVPTDANGDYFVFSNPQSGKIKYFNPHSVNFPSQPQDIKTGAAETEEQKAILELWNTQILPQRDAFIAQARAAYQPFLELIPEEYKGGVVEGIIKGEIENLYAEQEKELVKRCRGAAAQGKELDLDTPLPFELFSARMKRVMQALPDYLDSISDSLFQEEYSLQRDCCLSLFSKLFWLSAHSELKVDNIDRNLLDALIYIWDISTQERIDAVDVLAEFINSLKKAAHQQAMLSEIMLIVRTISDGSSMDDGRNISVVKAQLQKILQKKEQVKEKFLEKLHHAFKDLGPEELSMIAFYFENPDKSHLLQGTLRPFIIFLTNEVEELPQKARRVPQGKDVVLPEGGIAISQIILLEQQRPKSGEEDIVMDIDYLLEHMDDLPAISEALEAEILNNITVQRESGAYTAEIAQNTRDSTQGKKGELVVDFYLQKGENSEEEYVEEAVDNGPGAPKEAALIIPKSTKSAGEQMDLSGFFGIGKDTAFEGVDRLERITKNRDRAYMFTFEVNRDASGRAKAVRLSRIRRIDDGNLKRGVTIRRVKKVENTIPELDAMLAQRAWKTFTGLAQDEYFSIYIMDNQGNKQPLIVEKELLSQTDFIAVRPGDTHETNFGKIRIFSAKDMPLQVIDRAGLRISNIREEYLELINMSLHNHKKELGLIVQIPLPLIGNRSAFEHEQEYLPVIKKYLAIEFYKAIVYKTLTQTDPQFVFYGFPLDWEINKQYWDAIDLNDTELVNIAERINKGAYAGIQNRELESLLTKPGEMDKAKKLLKMLLLLQVPTDQARPDLRVSLLLRRLAIQQQTQALQAEEQREMLAKAGLSLDVSDIPDISMIPYFAKKIVRAEQMTTAYENVNNAEKYIVPEEEYSSWDRELVSETFSKVKNFGIEQVVLVEGANFLATFKMYKGKMTIFLNRNQKALSPGIIDNATDSIIHELAHLLENFIREDATGDFLNRGFVAHLADFTHDAVGTFAEAMKYSAVVSLANHNSADAEPKETILSSPLSDIKRKPGPSAEKSLFVPGKIPRGPVSSPAQDKPDTGLGGIDFGDISVEKTGR